MKRYNGMSIRNENGEDADEDGAVFGEYQENDTAEDEEIDDFDRDRYSVLLTDEEPAKEEEESEDDGGNTDFDEENE